VTGELTVSNSGALDYETSPSIDCTCEAVDMEGQGNVVTKDFTVQLVDIVDEPPVLDIEVNHE